MVSINFSDAAIVTDKHHIHLLYTVILRVDVFEARCGRQILSGAWIYVRRSH